MVETIDASGAGIDVIYRSSCSNVSCLGREAKMAMHRFFLNSDRSKPVIIPLCVDCSRVFDAVIEAELNNAREEGHE